LPSVHCAGGFLCLFTLRRGQMTRALE
jgi:hypothetical protein